MLLGSGARFSLRGPPADSKPPASCRAEVWAEAAAAEA